VLTEQVPVALVDDVVAATAGGKRRCRLLPDRAVMYFVLGLCLFSGADSMAPPGYRTVMRWLTNGLRHLPGIVVPTSPALTKARRRLGPAPMAVLFDRVRGPAGRAGTRGVVAFGRQVVAWDGTGVDVADTCGPTEHAGRPRCGRRRPAPPKPEATPGPAGRSAGRAPSTGTAGP
jgi:hypothetical protein